MSDIKRFRLSDNFLNLILNNYFGTPELEYEDTTIYIGLGIDFDESTFTFSKEPVSKGFTINNTPCEFSEPVNGVIRNTNALEWARAEEDWTANGETIKYLGLYYRKQVSSLISTINFEYELIGVLPLVPEETIKEGEKMVLNPNSIQIKLSNR